MKYIHTYIYIYIHSHLSSSSTSVNNIFTFFLPTKHSSGVSLEIIRVNCRERDFTILVGIRGIEAGKEGEGKKKEEE
jgi:hypothetical protein